MDLLHSPTDLPRSSELTEHLTNLSQLLIPLLIIMGSYKRNQKNPPCASRALRQNKRSHLPEKTRISMRDLASLIALAPVTKTSGTVSEPAGTTHAIDGTYFARWDRHLRLNIASKQLDIVGDQTDLNTILDLPETTIKPERCHLL